MARLRFSTDPTATVPLRFDDPEFIAALEADDQVTGDEGDEGDGQPARPLAKLLGVKRAADYDFSPFVDMGVCIHARRAVPGGDEDALYTAAAKASGGIDIGTFNRRRWALWVKRVTIEDSEDLDPADRRTFNNLSSQKSRDREEAAAELPSSVRSAMFTRLRAHTDAQSKPADRDPGKAELRMDDPPLVIQAS